MLGTGSVAAKIADELCSVGTADELTPTVLPRPRSAKLVRELDAAVRERRAAGGEHRDPSSRCTRPSGWWSTTLRAPSRGAGARSVCEVTVTVEGDTARPGVAKVARPLDVWMRSSARATPAVADPRAAGGGDQPLVRPDPREPPTEYDSCWSEGRRVDREPRLPEAALSCGADRARDRRPDDREGGGPMRPTREAGVIDAKGFKRASKRSSATKVDITVRNDLPVRVTRCGLPRDPDHPGPRAAVVDDELSYTIRGKMEPGTRDVHVRVAPAGEVAGQCAGGCADRGEGDSDGGGPDRGGAVQPRWVGGGRGSEGDFGGGDHEVEGGVLVVILCGGGESEVRPRWRVRAGCGIHPPRSHGALTEGAWSK